MRILTLSWRRFLWYRSQSTDFQSKSMDWFLYDRNLRHKRVKDIWKKVSPIWYVRKIFRKTNVSYLLIRTPTCAYQGVRNVSFSKNFAYVLNGWPHTSYLPFLLWLSPLTHLQSFLLKFSLYSELAEQVWHFHARIVQCNPKW